MSKTLQVEDQHWPDPETEVCLVDSKKSKKVCVAEAEFGGGGSKQWDQGFNRV